MALIQSQHYDMWNSLNNIFLFIYLDGKIKLILYRREINNYNYEIFIKFHMRPVCLKKLL